MLNPQLNTFIQVAENGSFSKAAEKLYITPSAVIQQINNLEKELQVSLFIRTRHGTQLTPAGEYLFQQAGSLLQTCREIEENLITLHRRGQRKITVGTSLLMKCRVFYPLWARFQKRLTIRLTLRFLIFRLIKRRIRLIS
ncbi:MAG: LysR family transcriptional regulator [Holdemania massiliensis]